jgi:hypothetical protein
LYVFEFFFGIFVLVRGRWVKSGVLLLRHSRWDWQDPASNCIR